MTKDVTGFQIVEPLGGEFHLYQEEAELQPRFFGLFQGVRRSTRLVGKFHSETAARDEMMRRVRKGAPDAPRQTVEYDKHGKVVAG
jgi:hypothetical protein